jgi:tRNA pseudouridine55 synthase
MQEKVITVYKKPGQTPLECINELKNTHPELKYVPLTYAGRLDPLAEGVLLILVGDECLKKDEYLALSKEYEVTILFGFSTDTYDVMGLIEESQAIQDSEKENLIERLKSNLGSFMGRISQKYPPYSSRTVESKPLFQWAREGKLNEITIPSHDVFIERIDVVGENKITGLKLLRDIQEVISLVSGDFRQEEILDVWKKTLEEKKNNEFPTITLKISCGSGVYVRAIAHELGKAIGIPALALKIVRTKVGDYSRE